MYLFIYAVLMEMHHFAPTKDFRNLQKAKSNSVHAVRHHQSYIFPKEFKNLCSIPAQCDLRPHVRQGKTTGRAIEVGSLFQARQTSERC